MENLLLSFNAVAPVFVSVLIGYCVKSKQMLDRNALKQINSVCFHYLLFALTFHNMYTSDTRTMTSADALYQVIFCAAGSILAAAAGILLSNYMTDHARHKAIIAQTFFRGNILIIGYPIAKALYSDLSILNLLSAVIIPLNNILAVVAFERYRASGKGLAGVVCSTVRNPLVLGTVSAILCKVFRISLPPFLESAFGLLASAGSVLTLIILGAYLNFENTGKYRRLLAAGCVIRLILAPGVFVVIGVLLGFRDMGLLSVLIIFGCPLSTPTFTMAEEMGADPEFGSGMVVFSTVFSCLTLFLWVFVLRTFALI